MHTYTGTCHCGRVTFKVEMDLKEVIECNCSHCSIKGLLLTFVPANKFVLLTGEADLSEYRFNKKVIAHVFCKICGTEPFGTGKNEAGAPTVAVNVRCLADVDLVQVKRVPFDGKNW